MSKTNYVFCNLEPNNAMDFFEWLHVFFWWLKLSLLNGIEYLLTLKISILEYIFTCYFIQLKDLSKSLDNSFTHSFGEYLLSAYYVPGVF